MNAFGVILIPLLFYYLWKSFQRDSGQHRLIKLGHLCCLACIVSIHGYALAALPWAMIHPSRAYEKLAEASGVFPTPVYVPIWIVTIIAYFAGVLIAYAAARRIPGSLRWLVAIITVLWVVDTVEVFRRNLLADSSLSLIGVMNYAIIFTSIPYGLMFLFYSNKKVTRALFEVIPDAEAAGK